MEIYIIKQAIPGKPVQRYVPNIRRAHLELGLSVVVDLTKAIRHTADWNSLTQGVGFERLEENRGTR